MKCAFCGSTNNKVDVINYGGKIVVQCVECNDTNKKGEQKK